MIINKMKDFNKRHVLFEANQSNNKYIEFYYKHTFGLICEHIIIDL